MLISIEVPLLQRDLISYKDSLLLFRILMMSDILFVKISPKYFCETHPCLLYQRHF